MHLVKVPVRPPLKEREKKEYEGGETPTTSIKEKEAHCSEVLYHRST